MAKRSPTAHTTTAGDPKRKIRPFEEVVKKLLTPPKPKPRKGDGKGLVTTTRVSGNKK